MPIVYVTAIISITVHVNGYCWGPKTDVPRRCITSAFVVHYSDRYIKEKVSGGAFLSPTLMDINRHRCASLLYLSNDSIDVFDNTDRDEDETQIQRVKDDELESFLKRSEDEWIDGKQMMQLIGQEERQCKEMEMYDQIRSRQMQQQQSLQARKRINTEQQSRTSFDPDNCISQISYTDANTLQITIPQSGLDSTSLTAGAFSAVWFSTITPATISMLSGGIAPALLVMIPFWAAGGVVAKTAIYDPFISCTLSIGQYLWTLDKRFAKREEGSTEMLQNASVELGMVVNNVPKYQLRIVVVDDDSGSGTNRSITFGKGLDLAELEYLSQAINEHCAKLKGKE